MVENLNMMTDDDDRVSTQSLSKVLQCYVLVSFATPLHSHKSWMVRTCESRGQVSRCSNVSFELLCALCEVKIPLRQSALFSRDSSAKSVKASPVFPGGLVTGIPLLQESLPGGERCSCFF